MRPHTCLCLSLTAVSTTLALNLTEVLSSTPSLSRLSMMLEVYPDLLDNLSTSSQATFFAPSNDALDTFVLSQGGPTNITMDTLSNLLSYHFVPTKLTSADLVQPGGRIVDTALAATEYANLEGKSNVVFASAFGNAGQGNEQGSLMLYSGVGGAPANVTSADVEFEGGILHVVNHAFGLPRPCTQTTQEAGLNTLRDAFRKANLWTTVDSTPKFTCFAPSDAAFQAAGIDVQSLSTERVNNLLKYHLIEGEVGYSTALEDGKQYQTMLGVPVTVHKRDGKLFVNNVTVSTGNIIMSNGVAHVLDGVLDVLTGILTPSPNATIEITATSAEVTTVIPSGASATSATAGSGAVSCRDPKLATIWILSVIVLSLMNVA